MTRRTFVATATGAVLAAVAESVSGEVAAAEAADVLAVQGGPRAVSVDTPLPIRWGDAERERLEAMLGQDSLFYWKGPQTELLKQRFRAVCPVEFVQTCSSGTAALHIAVAACGLGPGDEVITSPVTDMGTVIGVVYQQGVPVFADLEPGTYNLDPEDVAARITPRTRAIVAVHLAGNPCRLDALRELADAHDLVLIEDCAQAWGASCGGRPVGTIGDIACFSLQNSKHVTCGDGGVVASRHPTFGPLLQRFGDKGFDRVQGGFAAFATNYRMSEPQAAVAAAQMERVERIAARRAVLGGLLNDRLKGIPGVLPHEVAAGDRCVYWFQMFRLVPGAFRCDRAEFVRALQGEGVQATAGYIGVPLYGEPMFRTHGFFAGRWPIREFGLTDVDYARVRCGEAEAILASGVRMTIHEGMTEAYVEQAADAVRKVARHHAA